MMANLMNLTYQLYVFLLHGLFNTNLAAWCCIISNLWINDCWCRSHIAEQYSINESTCKHAPLGEVDNDGGFYIGILEDSLLCCKLSVCGVSMITYYYSITLPSRGSEGCSLTTCRRRVDTCKMQHFLTLNFICQTSAHIDNFDRISHDLLVSLWGNKLDNHQQKVLVDCGYWMLCHLYRQETKLDPALILVGLLMSHYKEKGMYHQQQLFV